MQPVSCSFGELTLKQPLGQGTYGEVYRGYFRGRKVAVKKIFPGKDAKERMLVLGDFEREISILKRLGNGCSRICRLESYVSSPNEPLCLIFELCEGSVHTLLRMIKRQAVQVSWRVCLGILHDAAEACAFLHANNVIHRDIKSENLLLEANFRVKLTDFGLSREVSIHPLAVTHANWRQ